MSDQPNRTLKELTLKELMDSEEWKDIRDKILQAEQEYEDSCEQYWDSLDYEDQLKAFYSVVKRICKGDVQDRGTYRYVLYEVFGFGPDAYSIGMNCGYMTIHNLISEGLEKEENADRKDDPQSSDL